MLDRVIAVVLVIATIVLVYTGVARTYRREVKGYEHPAFIQCDYRHWCA